MAFPKEFPEQKNIPFFAVNVHNCLSTLTPVYTVLVISIQVYLAMSYCYAERVRANHSQIISELREELYTVPYSTIDWPAQRSNIAPGDIYTPHSFTLKVAFCGCTLIMSKFSCSKQEHNFILIIN